MKVDSLIADIFTTNRKCIINADLDGILSGMLLSQFLHWDVVGFSACAGTPDDELWIRDSHLIDDCVFVDLPVVAGNFAAVDQHYSALSINDFNTLRSDMLKINPNILRGRYFSNPDGRYTAKYPFGTVHFVLAILERMGLIDGKTDTVSLCKDLGGFSSKDLLLRADRVVGNFAGYTANCKDWSAWLIKLARSNSGMTHAVFSGLDENINDSLAKERKVEQKLLDLGLSRKDGDCSNLLRCRKYDVLNSFLLYLSSSFDMNALTFDNLNSRGCLRGYRVAITPELNIFGVDNIFSCAAVNMRQMSITEIQVQ
jgi:hypothetical protein